MQDDASQHDIDDPKEAAADEDSMPRAALVLRSRSGACHRGLIDMREVPLVASERCSRVLFRLPKMTPLLQAYVAPSVRFFESSLRSRYGLLPYQDADRPAMFFGCYSDADLQIMLAHKSVSVFVWCGSDAMEPRRLVALRGRGYHVAISDFIAQDLDAVGISSARLPLVATDLQGLKIEATEKGEGIYIYTSFQNPDFYGRAQYERLRDMFPDIPFYICAHNSYPQSEVFRIYRKCFLGLRLVAHDGLSNTVVELALHGIKSVYNGNLPGSLPFRNVDEIAAHITAERKQIGNTDLELPRQMSEFLRLPPNWMTVEFFKSKLGPIAQTRGA